MAGPAPSNLIQAFNADMPGQNWQQVVLQAFQTWAVNSSINLHVVNDDGESLGSPGLIQGDPRFGDIRLAGENLGPSVASIGTGFVANGNRWSGTVIFNTSDRFGIGQPNAYDLFTVAMHEAGHVFGLPDQTTDLTSAMYQTYTGPRTGLSAADVAAFQSVNGTPQPDGFQTGQGNHSFQNAANLNNNQLSIQGDLTSAGQSEYFRFQYSGAVAAAGGTLTVQVQTSGESLFEPTLTVYDSSYNVVGSASSTNPVSGNVSVQISNPVAGMNYFIKVGSATTSVFGVGSYTLNIIPHGYLSYQNATNLDNNHLATSSALSSLTQPDYYKWKYDGHVGTPGAPVSIQLQGITLQEPTLTVYDGNYNVIGSATVSGAAGSPLVVTITNPVIGMTYYFSVGTAGGSLFDLGSYTLSITPQGVTSPVVSPSSPVTVSNGILVDSHQQHQLQKPENLAAVSGNGLGLTYYAQAGISNPSLGDYYQVHTPNTSDNAPEEMMIMAWGLGANGFAPQVQVFDSHGNVVPAQVIGNGNGSYSLDIPNAAPGQNYVVKVSSENQSGPNAAGNYAIGVEFNSNPLVNLTTYTMGTLSAAAPRQFESLQVNVSGGMQLVLSAQGSGQSTAQVQMTICDADGNTVLSLVTTASQQTVSSAAYLFSGSYTICFELLNPDPSIDAAYLLQGDLLSDPMGPMPVSNGTSSGQTTTTTTSGTSTLAPVIVGTTAIYF
jgi:hypothetical protein